MNLNKVVFHIFLKYSIFLKRHSFWLMDEMIDLIL